MTKFIIKPKKTLEQFQVDVTKLHEWATQRHMKFTVDERHAWWERHYSYILEF